MNEGHLILAGGLILQGCYIMYLWTQIDRYRRTLALATFALQSAYEHITGEEANEDDTE